MWQKLTRENRFYFQILFSRINWHQTTGSRSRHSFFLHLVHFASPFFKPIQFLSTLEVESRSSNFIKLRRTSTSSKTWTLIVPEKFRRRHMQDDSLVSELTGSTVVRTPSNINNRDYTRRNFVQTNKLGVPLSGPISGSPGIWNEPFIHRLKRICATGVVSQTASTTRAHRSCEGDERVGAKRKRERSRGSGFERLGSGQAVCSGAWGAWDVHATRFHGFPRLDARRAILLPERMTRDRGKPRAIPANTDFRVPRTSFDARSKRQVTARSPGPWRMHANDTRIAPVRTCKIFLPTFPLVARSIVEGKIVGLRRSFIFPLFLPFI